MAGSCRPVSSPAEQEQERERDSWYPMLQNGCYASTRMNRDERLMATDGDVREERLVGKFTLAGLPKDD